MIENELEIALESSGQILLVVDFSATHSIRVKLTNNTADARSPLVLVLRKQLSFTSGQQQLHFFADEDLTLLVSSQTISDLI